MKLMKSIIVIIAFNFSAHFVVAQSSPFEISIEPMSISDLGGLQSFAFGQADGKWLIVGGRLDGLHRRQPFASFDIAGHNNRLFVVDPVSMQQWSAPLTSLPTAIQEQLSATNMEFYQEGNLLYCLGGYGYSATEGDHTTFSNLTAINVSQVISSIINNTSFIAYFRQISDAAFQVTGGRLKKINNTFYLLGGQKFIGRYNPMGPNSGPGFIQEYTNGIRKFNISDDGVNILIDHLPSHFDSVNLHRRDYNAESQILPSGDEGITMFSGVFQTTVDLPFLNSVNVDSTGYFVNNAFQQYYNHYHCPVLPIYSEVSNEMHTVFFGGIAQFYDNAGVLVQDNNVPFVNTIARITRDAGGNMAEYKLPITMPSLLGAGAEFIPNLDVEHYNNEVFKLDNLPSDSVLIGYIYGGISSTQINIFFINDGTQSSASSEIFKVYIKKAANLSVDMLNKSSVSSLNLNVFPNPYEGEMNISFNLTKQEDVTLTIVDTKGNVLEKVELTNLKIGENSYQKASNKLTKNGVYFISLETSDEKVTRKLVVSK